MTDLVPNGAIIVDLAQRTVYFKLLTSLNRPATGIAGATLGSYLRYKQVLRDNTLSPTGTSWSAFSNTPSELGRGWYRVICTAAELTCTKFLLDLDDGDGNTFNSDGVLVHLYGGSGNTGGMIHR